MAIQYITYIDKVVNGGVNDDGKWLNENANEVKEVINNNADELATTVRIGSNISQLINDVGYITAASLPDLSSYIQVGDNISDLVNDSGYITNAALVNYLQIGDNVSQLVNDAGYITSSDIPSTPNLQTVSNVGNQTNNVLKVTNANNIGTGSFGAIGYTTSISSAFFSAFQNGVVGNAAIWLSQTFDNVPRFEFGNNLGGARTIYATFTPGNDNNVALFNGTVRGQDPINAQDFVTLNYFENNTGTIPTLQQVTDVGNTTSNDITINRIISTATSSSSNSFSGGIRFTQGSGVISFAQNIPYSAISAATANIARRNGHIIIQSAGNLGNNDYAHLNTLNITGSRIYSFPDASGTFALVSDLSSGYIPLSQKGIANGVVPLNSSAKIDELYLPDSVLGQVHFGGTYDGVVITASSSYPELDGQPLPLATDYEGVYFISTVDYVYNTVEYKTGDWIISTGVDWVKVDNTDSVSSVFGRSGAIIANEGDYQAFYPRLSQVYDNPSWINTLAYSKITGAPDLSIYYNKTEIDGFLANKIDVGNVLPSDLGITTVANIAYRTSTNTWGYAAISQGANNGSIAQRGTGGVLQVGDATAYNHAVNLNQLNNAIDAIPSPTLQDVINEGNTFSSAINGTTGNSRIFFGGDGLNSSHPSYAILGRYDGDIAVNSIGSMFAGLRTSNLTEPRAYSFPDKSGTFALLDDIAIEVLNEGNGVGYRIKGRDPANYGNIGLGSVDFSYSDSASTVNGPTGSYSAAFGLNNQLAAANSIVAGSGNIQSSTAATGPSIVFGLNNSTTRPRNFIAGMNNTISGSNSLGIWWNTIIGSGNVINTGTATDVTLIGKNITATTVSGGVAIGESLNLGGQGSIAIGDSGLSENGGTSIGGNARSYAANFVAGNQLVGYNHYVTVIGYNNDPILTAPKVTQPDIGDPLFIIGNGFQPVAPVNTKQNAYVMFNDATSIQYGIASYDDDYSANFTDRSLVDKAYVDFGDVMEALDEGSGIGYRIKGRDPANYGNIGSNAFDISSSNSPSSTRGAVGNFSFTVGNNTTASALFSSAFGASTIASGSHSFAIGNNSTASGQYSFSGGDFSEASGMRSFAFGQRSNARGTSSISFGYYNYADEYASFVIGQFATKSDNIQTSWVNGSVLFKVGNGTANTTEARSDAYVLYNDGTSTQSGIASYAADYSVSFTDRSLVDKAYVDANSLLEPIDEGNGIGYIIRGRNPNFYGNIGLQAIDFSWGIGASTTRGATNNFAFASGQATTASGPASFAAGSVSIASGQSAFAVGSGTQATGNESIALGYQSIASGTHSFSVGQQNQAVGSQSAAISGTQNQATGSSSVVFGRYNIANHCSSLVIGQYSTGGTAQTTWLVGSPVFKVGNGTANDSRSNAYVLYNDGSSEQFGKVTINPINSGLGERLKIVGPTASGTANWIAFYDNTNTRVGYVGFGSSLASNGLMLSTDYTGGIIQFRPNAIPMLEISESSIISTPPNTTTPSVINREFRIQGGVSGTWMRIGKASGNAQSLIIRGYSQSGVQAQFDEGGVNANGAYTNTSDIRIKNLVEYDYSAVDSLESIVFTYKDNRDNGRKHVGYSAQEVMEVLPDAVHRQIDEEGNEIEDGLLSVDHVQVLIAKVSRLEKRIMELEEML